METNEATVLPVTSYNIPKILKSDMSLPSDFSSHMSESSFQQIIHHHNQDQASAMLMFLYGDTSQDNSNLEPFFTEQIINNFDIKRLPEKKKRSQVRNACVNCQKSNKKCDETRPCSRCIKHKLTDSCINSKRKKRQKGIKRGPYKRRKQENIDKNLLISPVNPMVPLLETTPPTSDMGTSFSDFIGQPLFEFDTIPRFLMQPLPVQNFDGIVPYPTLSTYENGHTTSPATLINQHPVKIQENSLELMSTILDDNLIKGLTDHNLENRTEPLCRSSLLNHEADLGTLASLCAAVLGEDQIQKPY